MVTGAGCLLQFGMDLALKVSITEVVVIQTMTFL
jgi:hypothetical protein